MARNATQACHAHRGPSLSLVAAYRQADLLRELIARQSSLGRDLVNAAWSCVRAGLFDAVTSPHVLEGIAEKEIRDAGLESSAMVPPEAIAALVDSLSKAVVDLVCLAWIPPPMDATQLDLDAAELIGDIGPAGADVAKRLRESTATQLSDLPAPRWMPTDDGGPAPILGTLAAVLWADVVRDRLARLKTPALPEAFTHAALRGYFSPGGRVSRQGADPVVLDRCGAQVALVNSAVASIPPMLLREGRPLAVSSLTAQRVFRDIPHRAHSQALFDGVDLDRWTPNIVIVGGLTAYARALGMDAGATNELRAVLDLFQSLNAVGADGHRHHGLLTWREEPAAQGRKARIIITPASGLLRGTRGKLIPVPHRLPRFSGSKNEWAAQASLQLLVLLEMRSAAIELVESGGATIPPDRWRKLAEQAGVSLPRLVELLRSTWVDDSVDGLAFLRKLNGDRWTLGTAYERELAVLVEGGRYDRGGRISGRRSAAKRAAKANRLGDCAKTSMNPVGPVNSRIRSG